MLPKDLVDGLVDQDEINHKLRLRRLELLCVHCYDFAVVDEDCQVCLGKNIEPIPPVELGMDIGFATQYLFKSQHGNGYTVNK